MWADWIRVSRSDGSGSAAEKASLPRPRRNSSRVARTTSKRWVLRSSYSRMWANWLRWSSVANSDEAMVTGISTTR